MKIHSPEIVGPLSVEGSVTGTSFVRSGGLVSQFLKADGSVDSASYALSAHAHTFAEITSKPTTLAGYGITDAEGSIAAGTTSQYWRGDKTWQTLNTTAVAEGTNLYYTDVRVRAAALTGYTAGANTALAATDSILAAFGKVQGQINAREATIAAGTTAQYWRGDKTWQTLNTTAVAEGTNLYYTDARVRAVVLTGYVVGANSALAATDSLLGAFGKVQGQINAKENTLSAGTTAQYYRGDKTWQTLNTTAVTEGTNLYYTDARVRATVLTGYAVGTNTALVATDTILTAFGKIQSQLDNKAASSHSHAASAITAGTFASGNFIFPALLGVVGQSYQTALVNKGNSGSGTVTFNWNDGNIQRVTLTGNCTFAFSNPQVASYQIKIVQDGVGSRSISWPTGIEWENKTVPPLTGTANSVDWVTITYDGTVYSGLMSKNHGTP